jgi:hypothetical protein
MAFIAAVTEEIERPGISLKRLEIVTGSTVVAALGAFVAFLASHATLFGGAYAMGLVPWAVVLIGLYLWAEICERYPHAFLGRWICASARTDLKSSNPMSNPLPQG